MVYPTPNWDPSPVVAVRRVCLAFHLHILKVSCRMSKKAYTTFVCIEAELKQVRTQINARVSSIYSRSVIEAGSEIVAGSEFRMQLHCLTLHVELVCIHYNN